MVKKQNNAWIIYVIALIAIVALILAIVAMNKASMTGNAFWDFLRTKDVVEVTPDASQNSGASTIGGTCGGNSAINSAVVGSQTVYYPEITTKEQLEEAIDTASLETNSVELEKLIVFGIENNYLTLDPKQSTDYASLTDTDGFSVIPIGTGGEPVIDKWIMILGFKVGYTWCFCKGEGGSGSCYWEGNTCMSGACGDGCATGSFYWY